MTADILREKFLQFFKARKHKVVESDSLIPRDDPTVLFTPAGMNQFKREFLGFDSGFRRVATAQRCLRTDDLEKVGKTAGHHTFFEMLGNFSFGDYFKEEAISYAWEFLTETLKIDREKLWVSVYKEDDETYKVWRERIMVPQLKIIKLGAKENFWPSEAKEKGPNGPCGPCSEIFYDQGRDIGCRKSDCEPSCNCGRFVEVWNLVFTQFNRKDGGILVPLPKKNIDTGMGLERLAALMQGVHNNFETELFRPIIKEIKGTVPVKVTGEPFLKGTVPEKELTHALADHIRAIVFAIYDGVLPANEARGYVVRKLIRKSTLHLRSLEFKQPFLYRLVPVLSEIMKRPYPELEARKENIAQIILAEEESFISTLNSSNALFKDKFAPLLNKQDAELSGKIAFQLYDTYGIPLDLTKDWLDKYNIKISESTFNKELQEQKARSKLQSVMKGEVFASKALHLDMKETKFLGYKDCQNRAKILKIIKDGSEVKKINKDEQASIILDKTVFYPESGGQIGDSGEFAKGKNIFTVTGTQKVGKAIIHIGKVKEGSFKKNDSLLAKIDIECRLAIARNHTATHLLQAALRKVLGIHVKQQGSLVAQQKLRFDFTHFKDINRAELDRIEEVVNSYIINNIHLSTKQMALSQAKKSGALAFFGEKYEGKVRVVSIVEISKELCGGTHLESTGQIGLFKITQEGSIASGIRRIEAVTGTFAYKLMKDKEETLADISSQLNVAPEKIPQELKKQLSRIRELGKRIELQKLDAIKDSLDTLIQDAHQTKDIKLISRVMDNLDMEGLRKTVDLLKEKTDNCIIALGSVNQGRALLVMGITPDLVHKGIDAAQLILNIAKFIGGSGGGRKDFAQAGGNKPENFAAAFEELKNIIEKI